jgi:cytochrome c biogenesis protein CcmG/thiol:disulfide interchange protein DsbE
MRLWILVSILLAFSAFPAHARKAPHPTKTMAPGFSLPAREGTATLDSLRGRVVLIDFWASWCAPCRRSFPWLKSLHERYSSKGLTIVAINLDKDREAASAFLEQFPVPFVVAFDPSGKTAEAFDVQAMPSSYVVGPTGTVLYSHAGFDPRKNGTIEKLIQEACPQ